MKISLGLITHLNEIIPTIQEKITKFEKFCLDTNKQMPITGFTSYKLLKIFKLINEEHKIYLQIKNDLISKLGEQTEDQQIKVKEENIPTFYKELNKILANTIEITTPTILLSELYLDQFYLSTQELATLIDSKIAIDNLNTIKPENPCNPCNPSDPEPVSEK